MGRNLEHRPATTALTLGVLLSLPVLLVLPMTALAENQNGSTRARAGIDFRIVIPAIVRAKVMSQMDSVTVEDRHIAAGYIDLDESTSLTLTSNSRNGYVITASYDTKLLSRIDIKISNQNLTASSGTSSMRVASGLIIDKIVPVSYRLHFAPGAQPGSYRWPIALVFSPGVV